MRAQGGPLPRTPLFLVRPPSPPEWTSMCATARAAFNGCGSTAAGQSKNSGCYTAAAKPRSQRHPPALPLSPTPSQTRRPISAPYALRLGTLARTRCATAPARRPCHGKETTPSAAVRYRHDWSISQVPPPDALTPARRRTAAGLHGHLAKGRGAVPPRLVHLAGAAAHTCAVNIPLGAVRFSKSSLCAIML